MKKAEVIERYGEEEYKRRLETQKEKRCKPGFIKLYGEEAYEKKLAQTREWRKMNAEKDRAAKRKWALENPDKVEVAHHEQNRKGGKYYEKTLEYNRTGLQGARNRIRGKHAYQYHPYKEIIAPDSQIHHEWCFQSAEYTGLALVEAKPPQYGYVDVIEILDGKITLLSEEEIKKRGRKTIEKEN